MPASRLLIALIVSGLIAGGCAKAPQQRSLYVAQTVHAYQAVDTQTTTAAITQTSAPITEQAMPSRLFSGTLAGRTLTVGSEAEIALQPGEVVLTFDDGPRPGKTNAVLDILDEFGVGATFMMIGEAASQHPDLVREVAMRGHTIGSHTYDHADLTGLSNAEAMAEVTDGEAAITKALAQIGQAPSPFFRFPYLAQSGLLRTSLNQSSMIVLGVDIDSKDYYSEPAATVLARTLSRLEARGRGVILFHDIHARTVKLLPDFLRALDERGYSVVRLQARDAFHPPLITAQTHPSSILE